MGRIKINNDDDNRTIVEIRNFLVILFSVSPKLMKQIDPLGEGWNGKYNGEDIPSTDYWFTIDYTENNQQKLFKAHFALKR